MNKHVTVAKLLKKEGVTSLKKKIFLLLALTLPLFQPAVSYAAETKSSEELTVLTTELASYEEEVTTSQQKVTALESQLADYQEELNQLAEESKEVQTQIAALNDQKAQHQGSQAQSSLVVDGPQATIQQLRKFSETQAALREVNQQLAEKEAEQQRITSYQTLTQAQLVHSKEQLATAKEELQSQQEQLQQTQVQVQDLQEKVDKEAKAAEEAKQKAKEAAEKAAASEFSLPITGSVSISSGFGTRADPTGFSGTQHDGIDFTGQAGEKIVAARDGQVEDAGYGPSTGNYVILAHDNGFYSYYFHLTAVSVSKGATVAVGDQVGTMGTTGNSTGVHLHFGLSKTLWSEFVDPAAYLPL
ncbi:M23 family metallopeptidase [Enterococcus sp. OL5]|uniref:M23 family metallopeptidase n=1 Tax=Enterococcus sp. OL5 TaxID=2590214 RepID=UPI00112DC281|nr:M23 family metallopeptidase [Enterococcus sp. OL5]TPR56363.1 peptidase M23 [Enterococcus sp. OL5]